MLVTHPERILLLLAPMVLLAACQRNTTTTPAPVPVAATSPATGEATVRIERVKDAEAAIAALGSEAWVFRYSGGPVTADFTIFYRPAGADDAETSVFTASGNGIVDIARVGTDGEPGDPAEGLIVVSISDTFKKREGRVAFALTQFGAYLRTTEAADRILPDTFFAGTTIAGAAVAKDEPALIEPGGNVVLVAGTIRISGETDLPLAQWASIRMLLTVTALKNERQPNQSRHEND
jgi:hypothetical protein